MGMLGRCLNKVNKNYANYGGRGITVCEEWISSPQTFFDAIGDKPGAEYSLDRIDNAGNYGPRNVRWATCQQQQNNKRSNRLITFKGATLSVSQWARRNGIKPSTLFSRLNIGWSEDKALTTPLKKALKANK